MQEAKQRVEKHLQAILRTRTNCEPLRSAMHEGLLSGGKRVRPFLLFASADLARNVSAQNVSAQTERKPATTRAVTIKNAVEDAAAALEMVHCYSLIHDDLPAMDNDLLRRGQPTLHVKVGVGQAILAGDALLTLAFEVLAKGNESSCDESWRDESWCDESWETRLRLSLCFELARAAGAQGMAGGQSWDLESEQYPEKHALHEIHALKTGALLRAACVMGARCFDADKKLTEVLRAYASHLGKAYQAIDDLRDEAHDRLRREQKNAASPPPPPAPPPSPPPSHAPLLAHAEREDKPRKSKREEAVSLCRRAERALEDYSEIGGEAATLLRAFARFLPTRIPQKIPQEAA